MGDNLESWTSEQPLIGVSSNFKLKLGRPNQNKKSLNWKQLPMEDDLKILKNEYISNHWSDFCQILNISLGDQPKLTKWLKGRWPSMKENLKILKAEYRSNY